MHASHSQTISFELARSISLIFDGWRLLKTIVSRSSSRIEPDQSEENEREAPHKDINNRKPAILIYGFRAIGRIAAAFGIILAGDVLDVRLGIHLDRKFAIFAYLTCLVSMVVSYFIAAFTLSFTIEQALPIIDSRVATFLRIATKVGELLYPFVSFSSFCWLVYHRRFLSKFLYYDCSYITIPKSIQIKMAAKLFLSSMCVCMLNEPVFVILSIQENIQQPRFFPSFARFQFQMIKLIATIIITIGTLMVTTIQQVIPNMNSYLSCSIEYFLRSTYHNLLSRSDPCYNVLFINQSFETYSRTRPSSSEKMSNLLKDYALATIYQDWPEVAEECDRSDESVIEKTDRAFQGDYLERSQVKLSSMTSSNELLFIYNNIVKTVIKIKHTIRQYESVFGFSHVVLVCTGGFTLTQWILICIVQTRVSLSSQKNISYGSLTTSINVRMVISFVAMTFYNWNLFRRFVLLPDSMRKLKNRLFKKNIDCMLSSEDSSQCDMIWSCYDRIDRISGQISFRLIGNANYSRGSLLLLCAQGISFVVLWTQVLDLFTVN